MKSPTARILGCALLLLVAGCGSEEGARRDEINALQKQVNEGAQDEERLLALTGEVAGLRRQLRALASQPLRGDPAALEERLKDTGTRLGLKVQKLREEGVRSASGPLDLRHYKTKARGGTERFVRWLQDLVTWELTLFPVQVATSNDPISGYGHELTLVIPVWTPPQEAARPAEPPDPGPEPEGGVEHQIWRLRQNLDRIQAARRAMPDLDREKRQIEAILAEIDKAKERSARMVSALSGVVDASMAGVLEDIVADQDRVMLTILLLDEATEESFLARAARSSAVGKIEVTSRDQTRFGLRSHIEAQIAPGP